MPNQAEIRKESKGVITDFFSQPSVDLFVLTAPVAGIFVPLQSVPDSAFSENALGRGIALDPLGEVIVAPCNAVVMQVHSARHALFLKTPDDLEILIHVGLDTVHLKGEGFTALVKPGGVVQKGQPLLRFNADLIAQKAKSLLTVMTISDSESIRKLVVLPASSDGSVRQGDPVMQVMLKRQEESRVCHGIDSTDWLRTEWVCVQNRSGLHARPASVMVKLSKEFQSELSLWKGNRSANARSLVGIMGLEVAYGDEVQIAARGADAAAALESILRGVRQGLGESLEDCAEHQVHPSLPTEVDTAARFSSGTGSDSILRGVTAAPGRVVGRVYQLKSADVKVAEFGQSDAHESQRLTRALREAHFQLEGLVEVLSQERDPSRAGIFSAHQDILEDPVLLERVRTPLSAGKSAGFAWREAYQAVAAELSLLQHGVMADRANDVRDVGHRVMRLLEEGTAAPREIPPQSILVAEEVTPSDVAGLDPRRVLGLVTTTGGASSHVAILARSLDLPVLAGADSRVLQLENGTWVFLDADRGQLELNPDAQALAVFEKKRHESEAKKRVDQARAHESALTQDGRRVEVVCNLKGTAEARDAVRLGAEGVGLLRTEFLFMDREVPPSEEEQFAAYQEIGLAFGSERPVVMRTLDVGGDKPLRYLPLPREDNPFLGERGLRVSLNRPDLFRAQLRAMLRAANANHARANIRMMFPMVSTLDELRQAKRIVEEERLALQAQPIPIGIMVEVPSVAMMAEHFAKECDFFSIGSNDLTQYTLAMDRGHSRLAAQMDGLDPSVLRLIERAVVAAHAHGKWVGVCGGIASDLQAVPVLLGLGVDELSVSIPVLPAVKAHIRGLTQRDCELLAKRALGAESAQQIRSWLK